MSGRGRVAAEEKVIDEETEALKKSVADDRPQIYVFVQGGIADYEITRGDVDVVHIDWDGIDDKYAEPDIDDLWAMRSTVAQIADPETRKGARHRLYQAIREWIADQRHLAEQEKTRREVELDAARRLLRRAGELA